MSLIPLIAIIPAIVNGWAFAAFAAVLAYAAWLRRCHRP